MRAARLLACALLAAAAVLVVPPTARAAWGDVHTLAVATDGGLWHDMRRGGAWSGFGDVSGQVPLPGTLVDVDAVSIGDELHVVVATSGGGIFHAVRTDGGWTGFGDVKVQSGQIGAVTALAATRVDDRLHVLAVAGDTVYHAVRFGTGSPVWSAFGDVEAQAGAISGVTDVAASGSGGLLHVTVTSPSTGRLAHSLRDLNGTWTGFGDVITAAAMHNLLNAPARVATAVETGRLHMIVAAVSGATFYTLRHLGGTWQQGYQLGHHVFGAQYPSTVFDMAALPGKVMIAMLGNSTDPARQLWRTNEPCTVPLSGALSPTPRPAPIARLAMAAQ